MTAPQPSMLRCLHTPTLHASDGTPHQHQSPGKRQLIHSSMVKLIHSSAAPPHHPAAPHSSRMDGLSAISLYSVPTTATSPSSGTERMRVTAGQGGGSRSSAGGSRGHRAQREDGVGSGHAHG